MRVLDDEQLVRALQELVHRRAHRAFDDLDEMLGVDPRVRSDEQRSLTALVMSREWNELQDAVHVSVGETGFEQALGRGVSYEPLRARAGVDAPRLDADDAANTLGGRGGDADEGCDLLRGEARDRRPALERVLRLDPHLGAKRVLSFDDLGCDVLREGFDEEGLADHNRVDRLSENLRKARHVDALEARVEVDSAGDLGSEGLLVAFVSDANRLLHARHSHTSEPDAHTGRRCLQIDDRPVPSLRHRVERYSAMDADRFPRLVSLACHDLRTPLATIYGFARTLARGDGLDDRTARFLGMIEEASEQMTGMLDELGAAARIEANRWEPALREVDTLELAASDDERIETTGRGETIETAVETVARALDALAIAAVRHGPVERARWRVEGRVLELTPVTAAAALVVFAEDVRDLGSVVARLTIEELGGSLELDGEKLRVRL